MKVSIKHAFSADVEGNDVIFHFEKQAGYAAKNPHNLEFLLDLTIGPSDSTSADIFDVIITTEHKPSKISEGSKWIHIEKYDWDTLRATILGIIDSCEGRNWYECVMKLKKYFNWEYEGIYDDRSLKKMFDILH
jgi:Immunity protein 8